MKFLISLFVVLFSAKECNQKEMANSQENDITITYQSLSRGSFQEVSINSKKFTLCNDLKREKLDVYENNTIDWNECLELLSKINTDNLPKLKAPTSMRLYDGAAHATLIIKNKEQEITSSSFDHGHPPAEIKALVEKLLSYKKIASKQ